MFILRSLSYPLCMASLIFMSSDIVTATIYTIAVSIHILSPIPIKVWGPLSVAVALCEGQIALHSECVNTDPGATMLGVPLWSFAMWAVIVAWLLDVGRAITIDDMRDSFEKEKESDVMETRKIKKSYEEMKQVVARVLAHLLERENKLIQKTE